MNEIVLADADREGEMMTARVIRYDREQRRLELVAPNTTVVFTLYGGQTVHGSAWRPKLLLGCAARRAGEKSG